MLSDVIKPENIVIDLESTDKDVLFAEMIEALVRLYPSIDRDEALAALEDRECKANTCVMPGIAVPHAGCRSVQETVAVLGISRDGVDYEVSGGAADGSPLVHVVVMLLFELGNAERHLQILADCASVLRVPEFYRSVLSAKSAQDVCSVIRECEAEY
ncbi:MAG: PTS sugar transporter subunit IIA [Treponemataceae bacterium]|nr:PTS sugar transporter subunit IIA [Treponemataceae bacterium]